MPYVNSACIASKSCAFKRRASKWNTHILIGCLSPIWRVYRNDYHYGYHVNYSSTSFNETKANLAIPISQRVNWTTVGRLTAAGLYFLPCYYLNCSRSFRSRDGKGNRDRGPAPFAVVGVDEPWCEACRIISRGSLIVPMRKLPFEDVPIKRYRVRNVRTKRLEASVSTGRDRASRSGSRVRV